MKPVEIKPGINWTGGIDWDLRNFHGYLTQRGSTYNAYLIQDEKTVLVDTVKHYLFDEMISRISHITDPAKIDYLICNHVEMDHSGSIPKLLEIAPNIKILATNHGKKGLQKHYKDMDSVQVVNAGDNLNIGKRTLSFLPVPMVHWPDSMVTYIHEEKILLSNDAFGQHIASMERFDDEMGINIVEEEAAKYYANIVMPYGVQVKKALEAASKLDIEIIAPSHGLIWRKNIAKIIGEYTKWADNVSDEKAVIIYDTMWNSTKMLAYALLQGLEDEGVPTVMRSLQTNHISDIITDVLTCRGIFMGSPTLNCTVLPTMGGFLTYLKGLKPAKRIGFAFGSYGWGGQGAKEIHHFMEDAGWELPFKALNVQYIPTEEQLDKTVKTGRELASAIKAGARAAKEPCCP